MKLLILFHLLSLVFALALFMRAFFPVKNVSRGFSTQKVKLTQGESSLSNTSHGSYRRLVLMVIDALRADFAFGPLNYFPKTFETIRKGHGLQFIARTNPPTVTLPRIKAITTGSTPSFIDVALNFGSPALEEDNIITQMKRHGRQIVFFGDDTWINLFPQHFERSDGTTSFYVSDYTEVDRNVTRHLKQELYKPTWDVMILHYLGLDHIGHIAGPSSPLVKPKLAEMDDIIRQIYNAMEQWDGPSLLVVCGDHGMSDQGGHGGATAGEISVPVLFLSPQIVNRDSKHVASISQADLCPTLSVLLGLPIPKNNLGKVIPEALIGYSLPEKVSVLHQNAIQAVQILKSYVHDLEKESSFMLYSKAKHQYHKWLAARNSTLATAWADEGQILLSMYSQSLALLAEKVTSLSTQYDTYAMSVSIALLWMLLVSLIISHMKKSPTRHSLALSRYASHLITAIGAAVLSHITMCTAVGVPSELLCQTTQISFITQMLVGVIFVTCLLVILTEVPQCESLPRQYQTLVEKMTFVEAFLLIGTLAHAFTLVSSSFVEEEHQTMYFLTTTVHLLLLVQTVTFLLNSYRRKYPSSTIKNAIDMSHNTYERVITGEDINNSCRKISLESVQPECDRNIQVCNSTPSGHYSGSAAAEPRHWSARTVDKEVSDCLHVGKALGKSDKPKGGDSKGNVYCISSKEFLHVSASIICVLVLLRVLRRWNQTGNKWIDVPDFGDWLILAENKMYLSLVAVFSMMIIGASQGRHLKRVQSMSVNLALCTAYLYRVAGESLFFPSSWFLSARGILEARASFFFMGITVVLSLLPTNCFKLDDVQQRPKTLPAIEGQTSKLKKAAYVPVLSRHTESPHCQVSERDLVGQSSKKTTLSHEAAQASSFIARQKKTTSSVSRSSCGTSRSSGQMQDEETVSFSMHQRLRGVAAAFLCFMCLVLRPHNLPVVAVMSLVEQMMTPVVIRFRMQPTYIVLYCLWMGQAFFFFQGNSNSLSTLDLTTGYTGLEEFTPAMTGPLLALATYAGTIFWIVTFLRIVCLMCDKDYKCSEYRYVLLPSVLTGACSTLLLSRALPASIYTVLMSTQRYHLFVWTVFSPKLLYEGANTAVTCVLSLLLLIWSMFQT
ncbi:unnamed protein product [Candidula unifasciata]|uniref:GPI ethanolamine phosphate transferase 2 C-terminal domain-containing protein n=1 Tax=Candidula unifasciata TaxID=100452 RepID=A0A8S3ZHD1_9EUPU|nr:unnamed protein product [Candidula unifasciata]